VSSSAGSIGSASSAKRDVARSIRTPRAGSSLVLGQTVSGMAASLGARLLSKPWRLGKTTIVARHADVREVLRRDLDFLIAPVNDKRIRQVNGGRFVLGMDRSADLTVEREALYSALADVDMHRIGEEAGIEADRLLGALSSKKFDAVGGYARLVAGRTAVRLFGVAGPPGQEDLFLDVVRAVFAHTFLNLGGDRKIEARAIKAGALMRAWIGDEIDRRRPARDKGADFLGALLRQGSSEDLVRRTVGGMLVGSIDTTATAVAKILVVMARDRRMLEAASGDALNPSKMAGWCREALRRWPHNPLVLRETANEVTLSGVTIPAGSRVIAWTQAAMQDAQVFPDPGRMLPDRSANAYLHFGAGLHPCAGRAINDLQIPMLVSKVLQRGLRKVGSIRWAGPFPDRLDVHVVRAS